MSGFNELIPQELINVFDERELELLIGGMADIDVEDWKKHTDYRGYNPSDEVVGWFWKCVSAWPAEKKVRLAFSPLWICPDVPSFLPHLPFHFYFLSLVPASSVHDRHVAYPCQRLQGPSGLGRTTAVYYREGWRGRPAAQVAHMLQPDRSPAL